MAKPKLNILFTLGVVTIFCFIWIISYGSSYSKENKTRQHSPSRKAIQPPVKVYKKPKLKIPMFKKPLFLEVQRVADHWEGDIHITGDWVIDMSTETASVMRFRFKQPGNAPSSVHYEVYRGSLFSKSGKQAKPFISAGIGPPPGKGKMKEFDINFKKYLPSKPDGKTYLVRLVGQTTTGYGVWSNIAKVTYKKGGDWGQEFPSPVITKVIGTKDAMGNELKKNQMPIAIIWQKFYIRGTNVYEVPAETKIQFLKKNKIVGEVHPVYHLTKKLSSTQTLIAVRTPRRFSSGIYEVRIKSSWGVSNRIKIFIGGNKPAVVKNWYWVKGGEYENHTWTEEAQGIATDGKYWYISSNNDGDRAIYKFTIGMKLVKHINLEKYGIGHVGGLDYYNKKLYVAIENPKRLMVLSTNLAHNSVRMYKLHGKKIGKPAPAGGTFSWCAVNPINGYIYTSKYSNAKEVFYYKKAAGNNYVWAGTTTLAKNIDKVQGGAITHTGKLIMASNAKPFGIYVYNIFNGKYYGRLTFKIDPDYPDYEEVEGLAISPPNTAKAKGKKVNVHIIILDNDKPDNDDVFFKHAVVPNLGDLFDY